MKLKKEIDFSSFLHQVKLCKNDVSFCTDDGDRLNLKSILSTCIFAVISANPEIYENGYVVCDNPSDYSLLDAFLTKG